MTTDTPITSFSIYNQMETAGNLEFLIFNDMTSALLYNSGPIAYGADTGLTWKQSPTLAFTLLAGNTYDIGALADVGDQYGYNLGSDFTENGLTSAQANQNTEDFNSPILTGHAGGRIPIILNNAPVPEASTTVSFGLLLALGLGAVAVAKKRKSVKA